MRVPSPAAGKMATMRDIRMPVVSLMAALADSRATRKGPRVYHQTRHGEEINWLRACGAAMESANGSAPDGRMLTRPPCMCPVHVLPGAYFSTTLDSFNMQRGLKFEGRPIWAEIRLGALTRNLRAIQKRRESAWNAERAPGARYWLWSRPTPTATAPCPSLAHWRAQEPIGLASPVPPRAWSFVKAAFAIPFCCLPASGRAKKSACCNIA